MVTQPELAMRSVDAAWNRARWETLAGDGNRYEVIDGALYMSTAPSFFHQWIVRQLFLTCFNQVDSAGLGLTMWSPLGVFMPGCDPVQPDLVVIRASDFGMIRNRHIEGVPALLVEVLSPGSTNIDGTIKRQAYARAGVPEYWIVRPASRDILAYSRPDPGASDYLVTREFGSDGELESATLPIVFTVASVFAGSPDTTI
jgi:Uma2 family endonuclease